MGGGASSSGGFRIGNRSTLSASQRRQQALRNTNANQRNSSSREGRYNRQGQRIG